MALRRRRTLPGLRRSHQSPRPFYRRRVRFNNNGTDALSSVSGASIAKCCSNLAKRGFCVVAAAPGINADQGLHFSRCVVLCRRTEGGCDVAYDAPPKALLGEAFPCVPGKRKPSREAAWGDLEDDDLLPPSQGSFSALVQRDWACLVQDRERVGALYASPVFHAVWLGVAFAGQGRDDARATLYVLRVAGGLRTGRVLCGVAFLKRVRHGATSSVVGRRHGQFGSCQSGLGYNLRGRRLFMCEIMLNRDASPRTGETRRRLNIAVLCSDSIATNHADDVVPSSRRRCWPGRGSSAFPATLWRLARRLDADPFGGVRAVAAPPLRGVEAPRRIRL